MNKMQSEHAIRVVNAFKAMLTEDARADVTEEHFGELALMIEAAIDASLVDQLNQASAIVQQAATEINKLSKNR